MNNEDFPMAIKLRMWAIVQSPNRLSVDNILDDAEKIIDFIYADFVTQEFIAKEDIN